MGGLLSARVAQRHPGTVDGIACGSVMGDRDQTIAVLASWAERIT